MLRGLGKLILLNRQKGQQFEGASKCTAARGQVVDEAQKEECRRKQAFAFDDRSALAHCIDGLDVHIEFGDHGVEFVKLVGNRSEERLA